MGNWFHDNAGTIANVVTAIVVTAVVATAATACVASVICGIGVAIVAIAAGAIGAAAGYAAGVAVDVAVGNKPAPSRQEYWSGMAQAAGWGAAGGALGGAVGALAGKAAPYVGKWIGSTLNPVRSAAQSTANAAPRLIAAGRQAATESAKVTQTLGNKATSAAAGQAKLSPGAGLVQATAQKVADAGLPSIKALLSGPQSRALANRPYLDRAFAGTHVHEETASILEMTYPTRFKYNRVGVDFLDRLTGEKIELTTEKAIAEHVRRGGDYLTATYVTYRIP